MGPADRKRVPKVREQDIDIDASIDDDEPTREALVEMLRRSIELDRAYYLRKTEQPSFTRGEFREALLRDALTAEQEAE